MCIVDTHHTTNKDTQTHAREAACAYWTNTLTHTHTPHTKKTPAPPKKTWEGACAYWPLQGGVAREQDATEHARARGLPPPTPQ